jgi:hypothetical protein
MDVALVEDGHKAAKILWGRVDKIQSRRGTSVFSSLVSSSYPYNSIL